MKWISTGHNDWFKIKRTDSEFEVKLDYYPFKKMKFHDAADYSASVINQKWGHVYIAFSGGYDSELVCEAFRRTNMPFTPIIIDAEINEAETAMAYDWCDKNAIEPIIKKMSEEEYFTENLKYLYRTKVHSYFGAFPIIAAELVKEKNGKILTGMDDPWTYQWDHDVLLPTELQCDDISYLLDLCYPNQHPNAFFTYTQEFFYALISEADYSVNRGIAKNKLYNLKFRNKILLHTNIRNVDYQVKTDLILRRKNNTEESCVLGHKDTVIENLNKFII